MYNIEFCVEYYFRYSVRDCIIDKLKLGEGWSVLYALPFTPSPLPPSSFMFSSTSTNIMNPDGTYDFIPAPVPQPEPMIEVCYIKRNWESNPCPRCSYPYQDPDRLDREV
jgi:hypothetical protein